MWSETLYKNIAANEALLRRALDVTMASVGIIVLSPVLLMAAGLVNLTSRGPVLHRAKRVGKDGAMFTLYKFRSMRVGADHSGPGITREDDDRVTTVGRWLRRYKVDELPQLFNVLKGEMSLVGPRPEDPRYVALYTPEQRQVLSIRPGVTGAASVMYRHEESLLVGPDWEKTYIARVMPDKLRLELEYLQKRTLRGDLELLGKTVVSLFK